ncbi:putative origin recognition complex subunit 3-like [Penaeus vannamei]|uniref:Origin recognition complex subunit 3 n=2 Tax=Penaeus TaxID=133894 RepID=A0A423U8J7_PENVA|nr:origin recognition complex subunit 3-like [Penaeus vannamei]ROT85018.1 putative origin recognition complex subunit 3-like [Penaeus vannamei]
MAATVSVSKGVFAFKRPKTKKNEDSPEATSLNYWTQGDNEDVKLLTYKSYVSCWQKVNKLILNLQKSVHAKVFEDLVEFVKNAGESRSQEEEIDSKFRISSIKSQRDIPTACLVTGVNMPDHEAIFGSLVRMLKDGVTPHIAQLHSRNCTTVRGAAFKMISQLMGQNSVMDPDFVDEVASGPSVKRAQCTMSVLNAWYKDLVEDKTLESTPPRPSKGSPQKSPRKSMQSPQKTTASPRKNPGSPRKGMGSPRKSASSPLKSESSPPKKMKTNCGAAVSRVQQPLVIIFEDVESFPTNILHDLILICSEHCSELPFVFVFGVATTPAAVHRSLSQDASACIAIETFQAQPSTHYLNQVIEQVLMSEKLPFHIGGRTFKLLLDIFLYHDLSVKNFIKALQLCMIEHFMANPATFLCCTASSRSSRVKNMTSSQLDIIRKLPSFRSYVEGRPPKEQAALLLDEKVTKETIQTLLSDLDTWYKRFCCLVKVVHALTNSLPGSPLGRHVREVLITCLSQSLVETEEYKQAQKLLGLMAREELLPILREMMSVLQEYNEDEELSSLYDKLVLMMVRFTSLDQLPESVEEPKEEEDAISIQASDRFQLKEKLQELAKKKAKKPNAFESLRAELLHILEDVFITQLQPPVKRPLHEIQFFDCSSTVKRHLIGMPRAALTTALSNPHHYLQCNCCKLDDPTSIITTMPDVSVVYKLHLECGRLINLYDWLQAFISVVDPEADTSNKKAIDQKLQARFVQGVSELQFLGFIKPTRRKTDHVARLTWGGC